MLGEAANDWQVPRYIKDGLVWLNGQIRLELEQESAAIVEATNQGGAVGLDVDTLEAP